jgi:hypothetical protein
MKMKAFSIKPNRSYRFRIKDLILADTNDKLLIFHNKIPIYFEKHKNVKEVIDKIEMYDNIKIGYRKIHHLTNENYAIERDNDIAYNHDIHQVRVIRPNGHYTIYDNIHNTNAFIAKSKHYEEKGTIFKVEKTPETIL